MNPEHLKILEQGVAVWNRWRDENPGLVPDLSRAIFDKDRCPDFRGINFSGANLSETGFMHISLREADFTQANLSEAHLFHSDIRAANLKAAELFRADFSFAAAQQADFSYASLLNATGIAASCIRANFKKAFLENVNFNEAILVQADFSESILLGTVFGNSNLKNAKGLNDCIHQGPSIIDPLTMVKSGPLPEKFLRRCGVPDTAVEMMLKLSSKAEFYSAFIGYGEPDVDFAKQLYGDLSNKGISCWMYAMDRTPGKRTWQEIGEKRRAADKTIILCSVASLIRDGALKEIEEQMDEDAEKLVPISLDNLWKEPGFKVMRGARDLKPFLLDRNYADFSEPYAEVLADLLKALRRPAS